MCDFLDISYRFQIAIILKNYKHISNSSKSVIRFTPSWWYQNVVWPMDYIAHPEHSSGELKAEDSSLALNAHSDL